MKKYIIENAANGVCEVAYASNPDDALGIYGAECSTYQSIDELKSKGFTARHVEINFKSAFVTPRND